jgi:SAM-dependent methyltransferase
MDTLTLERCEYDALAPAYDVLTSDYRHEPWIEALEALIEQHSDGPRDRVLDVACGTGKTLLPWLDRGCQVTGCDASAGMLAVARAKAGDRARLVEADMRALGRLGSFDVVTCLDDALNHLLSPDEVDAAVAGMARNLRPGGVLVFDVNTLATLRTAFSTDWCGGDGGVFVAWHGTGPADLETGGVTAAEIDVFSARDDGSYAHAHATIRERHHPLGRVLAALRRAGLEPVAVHGQQRGARLRADADEVRDHKLVLVARRPAGLADWARAHDHERRLS